VIEALIDCGWVVFFLGWKLLVNCNWYHRYETLGGTATHCSRNFWCHRFAKLKDDKDIKIKNIVNEIGDFVDKAGYNRAKTLETKSGSSRYTYGHFPKVSRRYDMKRIIKRIVDNSEFDE
jgi:acetyl-CoA carboxylase carboxyltransferase component